MKTQHISILGVAIVLWAGLLTFRPHSVSAASHDRDMTRYVVQEGDSLSKIARRFYQDRRKWKLIFDANRDVLKTPDTLRVGWSLCIPQPSTTSPEPSQPQPATVDVKGSSSEAPPTTEPFLQRTLVTRDLYPPFVHQSIPYKGMLTDIIHTAFEATNYEVDILFRPLGAGRNAAREGQVTGTFPHASEPDSHPSFFSSHPIYRVQMRAFVRTGSPISFNTLDDLQGLVLCQPVGKPTAALQPLITNKLITFNQPSSLEACFHALANRRVDMVVADEFGGRYTLDNMGLGQPICILSNAVATETLHVLFSKIVPQSRLVMYEFDQALQRLEKDRTLESITTRHLQAYYKTLSTDLQTCQSQSSQDTPQASQNTSSPTLPPPPTQTALGEPAPPTLSEHSKAELTRVIPLPAPHRQAGEFLDFAPPQRAPKQLELVSLSVTERPQVDGYAKEPIWELAPAVTTQDAASQRQITLKSVHTADEIFFLVTFPDQAASETHQSWGWDASVKAYKPMKDREDTFVFKWSMVGNQVHIAFQNAEPHRADIWQWKALRTNPMGYADDKIHLLLPEPHQQATLVESPNHGFLFLRRLADAGQGAYQERPVKSYIADYLPRFYSHQPEGSRADIRAKGVWHSNAWTLEFGRKMHTGNADDIQFDPGEIYLFAVSCYEMGYGKLQPHLTQPLYHSGDAFDRLLLKVARSEEG